MRLGFACHWDPDPAPTWSFTPWHLREALRNLSAVDVVDVGVRLPRATRSAFKLGGARRVEGRWVTTWKHSTSLDKVLQAAVARNVRRADVDAVLQVQDIAVPPRPFYLYQDLSYDLLLAVHEAEGRVPHFPGLTPGRLHARQARQREVYAASAGVFAMSAWFARSLVELSAVPADKVHVLHPGRSTQGGGEAAHEHAPERGGNPRLDRRRTSWLFLGKDFVTKGGDVVVAAFNRARADDPNLRLVVAGPDHWPLRTPPPQGVQYVGRVPSEQVPRLLDEADVLVMPSRLEGFGKVFVEALAVGLPCVARDAFAMPEIVEDGVNGALVSGDDADALAAAVRRVLDDEELYTRVWERRRQVADHYSWERAASTVVEVLVGQVATR